MKTVKSYEHVIRTTFPFDHLTDEQFDRLISKSKRQTYRKNQFLFYEEDEETDVFFLLKGLAKNVLHRDDGKQISVRYYYPGDLIGLMILLSEGQLNFSVQALEDCETVLLPKKTLLQLMRDNKSFSNIVLTDIGERMKSLYDEIKHERQTGGEAVTPLFRSRVRDVMSKPTTVPALASVSEAAKVLVHSDAESLVVIGNNGTVAGVLTDKQVIECFLTGRGGEAVKDWMMTGGGEIEDRAFIYEALAYFRESRTDCLPVINEGDLVGIFTAKSFLHVRESKYLYLSGDLYKATTRKKLASLSPKALPDFLEFTELLLRERTYPREVSEFISNYNDQIHRQALFIAQKEMQAEGYGKPPLSYCFIVMGSQGRLEQAFSSDQDNGLILEDYAHLADRREIEEYFHLFAAKVNEILAESGFPECSGGIMARERKWCRGYSEWKAEVFRWMKEADAEDVRNFTIFIDFRPIAGDYQLAQRLREAVTEPLQYSRILQAMLMKDTLRFRVPLQPLGRVKLKGKMKELDLKKHALMQIVNAVRIYAIRYGITEVNTTARLKALKEAGVFHPRDAANAETAVDILMSFRFGEHVRQIRQGNPLSNRLYYSNRTAEEKKQLKEALTIAKRLQQMTELSFQKNRGVT
ncbi:DUF294 nucleotidyltransferase-like domain-containing protein [Salisediminibacterium halotolerans]|uniref:DUF294 nucleotidyltransferase-like domain-containing protein n=1 Tax=Salisediminibacterium halotolerans TaxID=517425 RepID=UPI000EADBD4C|nr:DUF294 nucleotidyltransferase-like domain-containing protein [Salisediminibacterium halotolerans]RLJ74082.1 DNA polymerase-3 subunit epsilon/CBS domain-containing protein [Actinophytocola xinjiangensis]RPE87825.1 CBS domain-containing protein [Salisediminibacterium halotolerans]TWG34919.1 DNA polymerase-3 subunit epsilon/CBS domain-containing protein [Salisediminibacterium halotolerans]GEL07894.1 cyclic nucleotide-binding protein [Salisediminibacterium halotolerans]